MAQQLDICGVDRKLQGDFPSTRTHLSEGLDADGPGFFFSELGREIAELRFEEDETECVFEDLRVRVFKVLSQDRAGDAFDESAVIAARFEDLG